MSGTVSKRFLPLVLILLLIGSAYLSMAPFLRYRQEGDIQDPARVEDAYAVQPPSGQYRFRGLQADCLYYNFEEGHGNTARDLSTSGGNDGTLNGQASFTNDAKVGRYAMSFPADWQAYVKLEDPNDNLHQTNGYTFMAWIKVNGNGYAGLVMLGGCCNRRNGYTFQISGSQIRFWGGCDQDDSNYNTNSNSNVGDNQWHHIAITCNPSQLKIYVDGNLEVTGRENVPTTPRNGGDSNRNSPVIVIGGDNVDGACQVARIIDEVAVFGRELTLEEIREAMEGLSSIPGVDDVQLRNPTGQGNICYARHESYELGVNVTTTDSLTDVAEVNVFLDYNTTNATFCYNWSRQRFFKLQDQEGHIELLQDRCQITNDGLDRWFLNFTFILNFTFPHEEWVDCFTNTTSVKGEHALDFFPWLFRVENDMELVEDLKATAEHQGSLSPEGDWIMGDEGLVFQGPFVIYEGSDDIYPDDEYFDVKLTSGDGTTVWDNGSSGKAVRFETRSRNTTEPNESYEMRIVNIPGGGICKTNLSFPVKVDADAPQCPPELVCHAEGFTGRETRFTNERRMYVTWGDAGDNGSGLAGYYHSRSDNGGTNNGTLVTDQELIVEDLDEGWAPVFVWCEDNVGNIGEAAASGILVDLTRPVFGDLLPVDEAWHNTSSVLCSLNITDPGGSGVDGDSIGFSVSLGGKSDFSMWIPALVMGDGEVMTASVEYTFQEGKDNYVKWRARDVVGNDYIESDMVNVRIDTTPVAFSDEVIPGKEWYSDGKVSLSIGVSERGSGLDPDSLEARVSIRGSDESDFGPWRGISRDNISEGGVGEHDVSFTYVYPEGKGNFVMFRGRDLAGNPWGSSSKFNIKVDTTPVLFEDFSPDEEEFLDDVSVECFILARDHGAGVDPTTLEYSISTDGVRKESFGPWKKLSMGGSGNTIQVSLSVELDWGKDNYLRFRASDILGNGPNVSASFRVWCNSVPVAGISIPSGRLEYPLGTEIELNASDSFDADGDPLSFYWTSNRSENSTLGHGRSIRVRPAPGNHTVTLYVNDGNDNNVSVSVKIDIAKKEERTDNGGGDGPGIVFGSAGGEGLWLYILIAIVVFLLVLVLVVVLVLRRKKKERGENGAAAADAAIRPPVHPYRDGSYMPGGPEDYPAAPYQSYGQGDIGAARSYPSGMPPARPLLPPGPLPGPTQAALPFPALTAQAGIGGPVPEVTQAAQIPYVLPAFDTVEGTQDLNLMALPPAPESAPVSPGVVTSGQPGPGTPGPPSEIPFLALNAPASESSLVQELAIPVQSATPTASGPAAIPGSPAEDTVATPSPAAGDVPGGGDDSLSELEAFLAAFGSEDEAFPTPEEAAHMKAPIPESPSPGPLPPADVPIPPVPPPGAAPPPEASPPAAPAPEHPPSMDVSPSLSPNSTDIPPNAAAPPPSPPNNDPPPVARTMTMQCHSCANPYSAEVSQVPVIVACPYCGSKGLVESL